MSYTSPAMGIPMFNRSAPRAGAEPRDDLHVPRPDPYAAYRPGIEAAIKAREAAIQAGIEAQQQAAAKARADARSPARCAEIERRIFNQVAVGGIFNGRS